MPLADAAAYPLWLNALLFAAAGIVVWIGGTRLTVQVDRISAATGVGQAFAGMLFLGGVTSLPEVANVITYSAIGNPALAVNNLLGSAAINVFLLAVGDAFLGRDALTSVVAKPSTLMMSVLCMLVLVAVAAAITTGDVLVGTMGAWGVAIGAISVGAFWLAAGYGGRAPWGVVEDGEPPLDTEEGTAPDRPPLSRTVAKAAVAAIVIFLAGYTLSQTGDALAEQTGIGSGMVGFALIGLATSLPELSTIVAAVRLGRYEMAFGQVLGTNFVNLSLVVLADAVFTGGPVIDELGRFEILSALLGATLIGVFLIGLLERRDATIARMGYDSFAVIVLFFGGLSLLASIG